MALVFARPMHDLKIKRLEPSASLHDHTFWLLEVSEPSKAGMVGHHREVSPSQIMLEELNSSHHCEQFFVGSTVALLASV